jgi:hypothetical protein
VDDSDDDFQERQKSKKVIVEDIAIKEDEVNFIEISLKFQEKEKQDEPERHLPVTYHDLRRICLKRDNIAAAIEEPYFDSVATGNRLFQVEKKVVL